MFRLGCLRSIPGTPSGVPMRLVMLSHTWPDEVNILLPSGTIVNLEQILVHVGPYTVEQQCQFGHQIYKCCLAKRFDWRIDIFGLTLLQVQYLYVR